MMIESNSAPEHKRLVLPIDLSVLDRVVEVADTFARAHMSDEELAYRIVLLTTEAVTNAIEHGNQLDPGKSVILDFSSGDGYIEISVQDEGEGFDPESRQNPLAEENLLEEGGRGIFLIESMADEFFYELGGRKVRMVFHLHTS
jgi:serine/threonine-protein kinase RsbW